MDQERSVSTLKCVVAWSNLRNLCDTVSETLENLVPDADQRRLGDDVHLVFTAFSAGDIREWLRPLLREDEGLLVLEFETWSGYGAALDSAWLIAHGH